LLCRAGCGFSPSQDQRQPILVELRHASAALASKFSMFLNPAEFFDGDGAAMAAHKGDFFGQDAVLSTSDWKCCARRNCR
jgi:hypothetical protein